MSGPRIVHRVWKAAACGAQRAHPSCRPCQEAAYGSRERVSAGAIEDDLVRVKGKMTWVGAMERSQIEHRNMRIERWETLVRPAFWLAYAVAVALLIWAVAEHGRSIGD